MATFKEYDSVIYTDTDGKVIDTFVIEDTDTMTGLTHINYMNLKVGGKSLKLHSRSLEVNHIPVSDIYSLELLRRLKAKFTIKDKVTHNLKPMLHAISSLSKAS